MIVLALITAGLAGCCVVVAAQKTRAFVEHVRATYRANILLHGEIARLTGELESAEATVELLEAALARKSAEADELATNPRMRVYRKPASVGLSESISLLDGETFTATPS